jgi:ribosomal protein S18 acetylase RimI-like enzyme
MPTFQVFLIRHIPDALALWRSTAYIGLSSADEPNALVKFLRCNPGFSFVALESETLVGAVLCGHDGRRGYIHHLAVASSHRKRGIGSQLLSLSLERLFQEEIFKCHSFVFQKNPYTELFWGYEGWVLREDLQVFSKLTQPDA